MSDIDEIAPEWKPEPEAEPAPPPAPEPEQPQAQAEDEDDIPTPQEGEPTVPRRALEDERRKRRDHKEEAARLAGELSEVRRRLEEMERASKPAPQPYQPPPVINPAEDPQGFIIRTQEVMLNERLNTSEMLVRDKHGDEKVEQAIASFKEAAQADPSLMTKLYSQPNPYGWLMKEAERREVQKEIGEDPAAYRARIRAEIEAEVRGQQSAPAAAAPRVSPAAGLAPSLANVRSSAPRTSSEWTQAPSVADIFPA